MVDAAALVSSLRKTFDGGRTRPLSFRLGQLAALQRMIEEREGEILEALRVDVGKPRMEAYVAELGFVLGEIAMVKKKLPAWTRPERVAAPASTQPARAEIHKDPLGVVLLIGPWNYPFQLVVAPLIGAIAAGNCAVVKPSEMTPNVSALLARLLPQYLDPDVVKVVEGGVAETTALLEQRFDHIFYTGNGTVGRVVMGAAAKHLTPVTLELGGKSPCIVDKEADLDVGVRRIVWGKYFNAGQTCIAPDYVLAHASIHDKLLDRLRETIREFYGDDPQRSPDYARIVNARHHQRLSRLLGEGEAVTEIKAVEAERYLSPVVLRDVPETAKVMHEEIFGPILPVLKVHDMDEAISFVNRRDKPLALYVFSENEGVQREVIDRTTSGGATVNHTGMHFGVPNLPFGGVGESGMGAYHGKLTFDTFTHRRAVLIKPTFLDASVIYPPYTSLKEKIIRMLL
ncbi:MAG: aldehyde dehydrogenase family protein [Myxococcales bacterium]|nr:aldehyde dehydrogenase family protein [Myxococcales bacterium]